MGDKTPQEGGRGLNKAPGQQKVHTGITKPDGTPSDDVGHGPGAMTQEQWRQRDKSLGLVRPPDSELEETEKPPA